MKQIRSVFLFLLFLISVMLYAQRPLIELTFTAKQHELHVALDSVLVMNLNTGIDTLLYAPDTVLLVNYLTDINEMSGSGNNSFLLFPGGSNPFSDFTTVDMWIPDKGDVSLKVINLLGKTMTDYNKVLSRGLHSFTFYAGTDPLYLIIATWNKTSRFIKLINQTPNRYGVCRLIHTGSILQTKEYKSDLSPTWFTYNKGDELRFIAYATTGEGYIGGEFAEDKPQTSKTYTFDIRNGIPCAGTPVVEYNDKTYRTVQIGSQCWFAENADHPAPGQNKGKEIQTAYGKLYNWTKAITVCPQGWHLPSVDEWDALGSMLGGPWVAGAELKDTGTTEWDPPNTGATNETGFTGLPGGYYDNHHDLFDIGKRGMFWSSTEAGETSVWVYGLFYDATELHHNGAPKNYGFSVRCILD